jgi:hypothetical protein
MPSDHKPSLIVPVSVLAVVLLASYFGAYYSAVVPVDANPDRIGRPIVEPEYTWGSGWFFAPAHWFDRCLRPDTWPSDDRM